MTIDNSANTDNSAFINTIETSGVVKNLNFADASISGAGTYTATVACINMGLIENCEVSGSVSGLVSGSVTGSGQYVGGIVGDVYGYIFACINNATITASPNDDNHCVGGIAACTRNLNTGKSYVVACANKGKIDFVGTAARWYNVGGLVGNCDGTNANYYCAYGSWTVETYEYGLDGLETADGKDGLGNFYITFPSEVVKTPPNFVWDNYTTVWDNTKVSTINSMIDKANVNCNYKWEATSGYPILKKTN